MKLYDFQPAPNPRRVRIFMAEKEMDIPTEQVNLRGGEQFQDDFRAKNPRCLVPWLELDDGSGIGEVVAIWRYLEELQPEPTLLGRTPEAAARITMWEFIVQNEGMNPALEILRNSSPMFEGRAVGGASKVAQIPELAKRGRARLASFYEMLDAELANRAFVAGDTYSAADITALITVDFAERVEASPPEALGNLGRWHAEVSSRPSAQA